MKVKGQYLAKRRLVDRGESPGNYFIYKYPKINPVLKRFICRALFFRYYIPNKREKKSKKKNIA